ncbi:MAG: hypothetical protein ACRD1K_05510 [Acidimicrobiales bacterium]
MAETAVVVGAGATGVRAARELVSSGHLEQVLLVDTTPARAGVAAHSLGPVTRACTWAEALASGPSVVVLAAPGDHGAWAEEVLARSGSVVSTAGSAATVGELLGLDGRARTAGGTVVVGAGFAPGLSCLLARHAADGLDSLEEIHVAKVGAGGPSCVRELDEACRVAPASDWRDGRWVPAAPRRRRELRWFPEPIAGRDCFPAAVGDAAVLVSCFPGIRSVTARVAVSRRDRLSQWLPALRRPAPEGRLGAVWVEVRGHRGPVSDTVVLGALDRPALAAGIVAGLSAVWLLEGRITATGAAGLAGLVSEPLPLLQELARRGIRGATFEGSHAARAV